MRDHFKRSYNRLPLAWTDIFRPGDCHFSDSFDYMSSQVHCSTRKRQDCPNSAPDVDPILRTIPNAYVPIMHYAKSLTGSVCSHSSFIEEAVLSCLELQF
jgi:hypothetical protein